MEKHFDKLTAIMTVAHGAELLEGILKEPSDSEILGKLEKRFD